jgi:hypothetical protein
MFSITAAGGALGLSDSTAGGGFAAAVGCGTDDSATGAEAGF